MFLGCLGSKKETPTDVSGLLGAYVSNIICSMLMSVRFHPEDPFFKKFLFLMDEGFRLFTEASKGDPTSENASESVKAAYNTLKQNKADMHDFIKKIVDGHRDTFDENNPRDIIDSYLLEIVEAERSSTVNELFCGKDAGKLVLNYSNFPFLNI